MNIVLVEPRIPQNVGNVGRSCVATGAVLHIVKPIPFFIDDKHLRRAGMDYWQHLEWYLWESLEEFWTAHPVDESHFFMTTKASKVYTEVNFSWDGYLYFGREDAGLDERVLLLDDARQLRIPMEPCARSLNLASAVAIVLFEAKRQAGVSQ